MSTSPSLLQATFDPPPQPATHSDSAYTTSSEPTPYPQFILFGDSITQGCTLSLQPFLQTQYIRRLDVVNRGFNGYTAPMGLSVLPKFLPISDSSAPSSSHLSPSTPQIKILTLFFGANDACVSGPQHVPLSQYTDALTEIIHYPVFKAHATKIVIVTPPPVDEYRLSDPRRTAAHTVLYADAARSLAKSLNLPCVDLWTLLMKKAGWTESMGKELIPGSRQCERNQVLGELLSDGLHFTELGYVTMFYELMAVIKRDAPELAPENLPYVLVDWATALSV